MRITIINDSFFFCFRWHNEKCLIWKDYFVCPVSFLCVDHWLDKITDKISKMIKRILFAYYYFYYLYLEEKNAGKHFFLKKNSFLLYIFFFFSVNFYYCRLIKNTHLLQLGVLISPSLYFFHSFMHPFSLSPPPLSFFLLFFSSPTRLFLWAIFTHNWRFKSIGTRRDRKIK